MNDTIMQLAHGLAADTWSSGRKEGEWKLSIREFLTESERCEIYEVAMSRGWMVTGYKLDRQAMYRFEVYVERRDE